MISLKNTLEAIKSSISTINSTLSSHTTSINNKASKSWTLLGSKTGKTAVSINLNNYSEALLVAYGGGRLFSMILPTGVIPSSATYVYGSGGYSGTSSSNSQAFAQFYIGKTTFRGEACWYNASDKTSSTTFYIYAR